VIAFASNLLEVPMATRWKKSSIIRRRRKGGHTFQVVYHDPRRGRRKYDRSFRSERLAKEYDRKLELHLNGAGPHSELTAAAPAAQDPDTYDNLIVSRSSGESDTPLRSRPKR
jgi:hypothetical protein